ncbi:P-loop NTPase [Intestinibacillus massiliensis]|uniref:nucleotide-binding protein n=1 Tax=Intestinibacillus massiliensis TaxID=1871029 RepID=UPI000B36253A|nr:P-loop NTPase [Intestinibacillus massiliensis]MCB6366723.1 P-loop NTPase [Intestinibacillus massiliensis]
MFKVIVIASGKGGTGKTSLSAGVATALADLGRRVLVIDGDSGLRNLDIVLGMSDSVVFSFADVARGVVALEKAAAPHPAIERLSMLTAPVGAPALSENGMRLLAAQAQEMGFEYVVIDGPAGLAPELRAFAQIATQGIVISTPDSASIRGAERVARLLEEEHIMRVRLVINRIRPRLIQYGLASNVDDAMDLTGLQLLGIVPEDEDVIACGNSGKSILRIKKTGASLAYRNIARRLEGERLPVMKV